ncbi:MAG: 50S ribosomal protein L24 [Methanobacteriota archaeon]
MKSKKARKQRKYLFNAPLHKKRKWIASHLEEKLLLKYDRRSIPVIKGDMVKVMRGSFKGHEDKISHVNVKDRIVEIEGVTHVKADGKKIARPMHPSNLLITKLNLTDKWRRKKLESGLTEETRKEIEKEAQQQLVEIEAQKKKADEETKKEEQQKKELEKTAEKPPEEKKPVEKKEPAPKKEEKTEKKPEKTEEEAPEQPVTSETPEVKEGKVVEKEPVKKPSTKKTPTKNKKEAKP